MDYWELFCDTGAPEAYLLWRGQQEAVCKTENSDHRPCVAGHGDKGIG